MTDNAENENELVEEEEVTQIPGWAPAVSLDLKDVPTGEEDEDEIYSQRSKLYRFNEGEWKERGLGESKLLRHRETGKIRYMMRQEKTGKIVANHYPHDYPPYCDLKLNSGSDKCWVWTTMDYSEEDMQVEQFALRFKDVELAEQFKEAFNSAKQENAKVIEPGESREAKEAEVKPTPSPAKAAEVPSSPTPSPDANPFAGLSLFGSNSSSTAGGSPSGTTSGAISGSSSGGLFGSMSSMSNGSLFGNSSSSSGSLFSGGLFGGSATGGLFSQPAQPTTQAPATAEEEPEMVEEEEVTVVPGWAPTVSLELMEVPTGEEEEDEIYSQRSKLYRFKDGEWKERGLGDSKLLRHRETGKIRFMLRQEKTGKIVANHYPYDYPPYCDLKLNSGSDKCWVWTTTDYSEEEEAVVEQFALKFKEVDLAQQFEEAFNNAKVENGKAFGGEVPEAEAKPTNTSTANVSAQSSSSTLGGLTSSAPSTGSSSGGLFGSMSNGSLFGNSSSSSGSLFSGGLFGGSSSSGGLFSGIAFGEPKADSPGQSAASKSAEAPFSSLSFATGGSLFSPASSSLFSSPASGGILGGAPLSSAPSSGPTPGLWGAAPTTSTANGAQEDAYDPEEEVTQIPGWAPSVNLDVKDYVETGEEGEEELYSQRSKLLRFVEGEWKERGTGDAKILRHMDSGKCRFLMRQEKTSKIVANHYIIEQKPYCELVHNAGNAKIWVWTALDYADEEQKIEQFALRFKTEELAEQFSNAFLAAKSGQAAPAAEWQEDDWVQAEAAAYPDGSGGCLQAMAQQQADSGWRCNGCRLMYGDQVIDCSICETARPGYEEEVAAAKADKGKATQNAMAAFLGTGTSTATQPSTSTAPSMTFGFGASSSANSTAPVFGVAPASSPAPAASSLFGSAGSAPSGSAPSSNSIFGSVAGPTATTGHSNESEATAPKTTVPAAVAKAVHPTSTGFDCKMVPPPPAFGDGMAHGMYGGYPCPQQFGMPGCMPQMQGVPSMPMPNMMGMPGMFGFAEQAKVDALERFVKDLQDKMKEMKDALDTERQERSKVDVKVQVMEKRLQEEEARSSRAESRATAAEAQVRQMENVVEGLRRSAERSQSDDSRLHQKNLEEQLSLLRQGLEQKASDESLRTLAKVLEQKEAEPSSAMKQRLEAVEARLERLGHEPAIISMSRPPMDRAAYFQSLHVQHGRRVTNGEEEPQATVYLADPKPLLRRIP